MGDEKQPPNLQSLTRKSLVTEIQGKLEDMRDGGLQYLFENIRDNLDRDLTEEECQIVCAAFNRMSIKVYDGKTLEEFLT